MRQMTEKMQAITSALDAFNADRKNVESKLTAMDERMRKLSTLTEVISTRYNPFVATDGAPADKAAGAAASVTAVKREPASPPAEGGAPKHHFPVPDDEPRGPLPELAPPPSEPPAEGAAPPPVPPAPWWGGHPDAAGSKPEFQRHMAVLVLAEHLLSNTNRAGAIDLLAYYERLGWMGPRSRRDLIAAMEGLPCRADDAPRPPEIHPNRPKRWSVDFHARSLALLARIRGLTIPPEDLVVLRRELTRLAGD